MAADAVDDVENLLLLCRVHHKVVDDQVNTYSAERLREIKKTHEAWVASTLSGRDQAMPVRVRRIKGNEPAHLVRLLVGRDVVNLLHSAVAISCQHDEPASEAEANLLAGLFGALEDYLDLLPEFDMGARVKIGFELTGELKTLEAAGFWLFGAKEVQRLEGGVGAPQPWPVAIFRVARSTSPDIISADVAGRGDEV